MCRNTIVLKNAENIIQTIPDQVVQNDNKLLFTIVRQHNKAVYGAGDFYERIIKFTLKGFILFTHFHFYRQIRSTIF